jgi:hypothetical protein
MDTNWSTTQRQQVGNGNQEEIYLFIRKKLSTRLTTPKTAHSSTRKASQLIKVQRLNGQKEGIDSMAVVQQST